MNGSYWHVRNEQQRKNLIAEIESMEFGDWGFQVQLKRGQRTTKQNSSLWLYLTQLSDALNEAGLDQRKVLKESVDIEWNKDSAAKYLWKPVQKAITGKVSTTRLDRKEVGEVYMALSKHIAEKFGLMINWPSNDIPMI